MEIFRQYDIGVEFRGEVKARDKNWGIAFV